MRHGLAPPFLSSIYLSLFWKLAKSTRPSDCIFEPLPLAELTACSYERWYPSLRKHSIPSTVLPLTSDFVEYLKADGVAVAWGEPDGDDDDDGWGDEEVVGGAVGGAAAVHGPATQSLLAAEDDEEAEPQPPAPRFPELELAVEAAISITNPILTRTLTLTLGLALSLTLSLALTLTLTRRPSASTAAPCCPSSIGVRRPTRRGCWAAACGAP